MDATDRHALPATRFGFAREGMTWQIVDAIVVLVALTPLLAVIAASILVLDGRRVLFTQRRIGKDGRPFRILKFRTLTSAAAPGAVREPLRQPRERSELTRVGRVLRRSHLDEIPQLVNVICGDMRLVGPRPLVPSEDALVAHLWHERHAHCPGLTGAWQVGRSPETTVEELIRLDQRYLTGWTPWRDACLLGRTAWCVIRLGGR